MGYAAPKLVFHYLRRLILKSLGNTSVLTMKGLQALCSATWVSILMAAKGVENANFAQKNAVCY